MISYRLWTEVGNLLAAFPAENYLLAQIADHHFVDRLAEVMDEMGRAVTAGNSNATTNHLSQARGKLDHINSEIRRWDSGEVYDAISALKQSLSSIADTDDRVSAGLVESASEFLALLLRLRSEYQLFVRTYGRAEAFSLLKTLAAFEERLVWTRTLASDVMRGIEGAPSPSGLAQISLVFEGHHTVQSAAETIDALQDLYFEICDALAIPEQERPFEVTRVEVGTLDVQILGIPEAIALAKWILSGVAVYWLRRWTAEGRINRLSSEIDVANALHEMLRRLDADGVDAPQLRKALQERVIPSLSEKVVRVFSGGPLAAIDFRGIRWNSSEQLHLQQSSVYGILASGEKEESETA